MVRIGVIGLGFMGRMHIAAYEKIAGAQLVAVADTDPKRAAGDLSGGWGNIEGAADRLDMAGVRGTTDFGELLSMDDVDVVDVCVPTPFHEEVATAALEAGKHVLCEKPLALDSGAAGRIAAAAEAASGFFMPAMCMRFWPQWAWVKGAVEDGRYGRALSASFSRASAPPAGWFTDGAMSGGAILDLHVHDSDFVSYAFGMPRAVFSRGFARVTGRTDHVATQYLYDGGSGPTVVTAEGSWAVEPAFGFNMRYLINFEHATADYDIARPKPLRIHHDGASEDVAMEGDGYQAELAYFVECVEKGERPSVVTAADAVASIRLVEAEQRSVDSGEVVAL